MQLYAASFHAQFLLPILQEILDAQLNSKLMPKADYVVHWLAMRDLIVQLTAV